MSRHGAMPLAWSLDKLGPLCRYSEDCAYVFDAIAGADERDPSSREVPFAFRANDKGPFRVAYDPSWFQDGPEHFARALEQLREGPIELVERPWPKLAWEAMLVGLYAESAAALEQLTVEGLDDQLVWQDDTAWPNTLRSSWFIPAADVVQADRLRRHAMGVAKEAFADVDAWVSSAQDDPMLVATNYVGYPSLTVRAGMTRRQSVNLSGESAPGAPEHQVPFSLTFWGGLDAEGRLIALGRHAESVWRAAGLRPAAFSS